MERLPRLLLVDDYALNRTPLAQCLQRCGFEVTEAEDGRAALSCLEREAFDLVLLDLNMPGIDGMAVLRNIRQNPSTIDLPVIMLSATDESQVIMEAFRCGANDYVTKPIDFAVTRARIEALLARRGVFLQPSPSGELPAPLETPEVIPVGAELGGYIIRGLIGQGGTADIYEAENPRLGRRAALKIIKREYSGNDEVKARFSREARAVARIEHPNVVGIYDFGVWEGHWFMAIQLIQGVNAQALVDGGATPWKEATRIVLEATRGLEAAHAGQVLHRDIKPNNILIGDDGQVKLSDFGLAKLEGVAPIGTMVTMPGTLMGTPAYMSPEQCLAAPLDASSDLYQMGCTFYALLTGRRPYEYHSDFFDIMNAHVNEAALDPGDPIPEACRAIVLKATQKEPSDRYPSAQALLEDLERAHAGS